MHNPPLLAFVKPALLTFTTGGRRNEESRALTLAKRRKLSLGRRKFLPGKSWRLLAAVNYYNVPINFV